VTTAVPFFAPDLFESDRGATLELIHRIGTGAQQKFILGDSVAALEDRIAEHTGAAHVVACASGTGALSLAVHALDVGPGDEVVVPAYCCQPVASCVVDRGATPVFVDIDPATLVLDPAAVEAAITPRTVALLPAHVFSVMADMPAMRAIADRHGLRVVEDAAVAQGAELDGVPAGRWGDVGVFSFFQVKALGTAGEGGVVLTDDDELGRRARMLRNHGQARRFVHEYVGHNNRMDEINAEFLLHRFDRFTERLARRADIAARYTERFAPLRDHGLVPPPAGLDGRCYYVYCVLTDRRDELRAHLADRGIGTHVYYPLPLPAQPAFARWGRGQRFPNAEAAGRRNLALPIWPHLRDEQVERIIAAVEEFHGVG
jgi:dTDP-4-amino-4,6-dideoxygalactose transaminase